MNRVTAVLLIVLVSTPLQLAATEVGYTDRSYTINACKLFGSDAFIASSSYARGANLVDVLTSIEHASMPDSTRKRAFQAVQFVWKNQLDNPVLAKSVAIGLCLKPKQQMAPMDEPWFTSPRTSKEFY